MGNIFSSELIVRWDEGSNSLTIVHPKSTSVRGCLVQIRSETLDAMSFAQASSFIGERLALLIPELRQRYVDPGTGQVR